MDEGGAPAAGDGAAGTLPVLYSFRRCPYAIRARLALLASDTACTVREVKLSDKPAALIAASPKATVPVLVTAGGEVIDQSLAIMRRALARHDPADWLAGDDAGLIAANDGPFKHHLDRYKYPGRHRDGGDPLAHRAAGLAWLAMLDGRIAAAGFLGGGRWALADAAIVPFVRQYAQVDRAWFDAQPLPAVHRWLAGALATPSFARAMRPRAPWRPGDPPALL